MKSNSLRCLKTAILAATLVASVGAISRAEVEDKITKSFEVAPGGQLVVEVDRGSIEVKTGDASAVNIEVTRKAGGSQSKAEKTLKDHVVTTQQSGEKVELRAKYEGEKLTGWFGGRSPGLQVTFLVTIPRKFDVDLKTAGGHIKVTDLTGKLKAHTSGGNLTFKQIEGPVSGHTSGGHINLAGCKGNVDLKTSGGNLTLSDIEGDVTASTSGGHISAEKLSGKSVVKTSGGNIGFAGNRGSIEAKTSGGHVTAELIEQPASNCLFDTSGGNITIAMAERLAVDVDASTSGGRVSTDLPVVSVVQGEQKKNELRGKINGGGPLVKAHTSGGNVRIEKK
jgi:DUF4097 and DUF4098 domain-containing protein YvlB